MFYSINIDREKQNSACIVFVLLYLYSSANVHIFTLHIHYFLRASLNICVTSYPRRSHSAMCLLYNVHKIK